MANEGRNEWEKNEEVCNCRPKVYSYPRDDAHITKRGKGTKKCVIKQETKFGDYKITKTKYVYYFKRIQGTDSRFSSVIQYINRVLMMIAEYEFPTE